MMDLISQVIAASAGSHSNRECRISTALENLEADDRTSAADVDQFRQLLWDETLFKPAKASKVAEAFQARGQDIDGNDVTRHRRGECRRCLPDRADWLGSR